MPAKPAWLLHVPEIVAQLEVFDVPVIDRAIVERLFGLRRRQAIELLHRFGGYQAGKTFLIERKELIRELHSLLTGEDFLAECQRKQRLERVVEETRRQRAAMQVAIPVEPHVLGHKIADLSPEIALVPGHLHITFSGSEDLLTKLYELAQAASREFDRFREAAEPVK